MKKKIVLYALLLFGIVGYGQDTLKKKNEETTNPEVKYDRIGSSSEGLAYVRLNGKYGFIDSSGKEVIPLQYDNIGKFSEGLAPVMLNDKWGFIDKTGKEVIPFRYDYARNFSAEGIAPVNFEGMWFYINKKGECVTDCHNAPADYPRMSEEREIHN